MPDETEVRVRGMHAVVSRDGVDDEVAVEEPLEIRVDGAPLAVTMRTPGHDEELAAGFLYGEGLIDGPPELSADPELAANRVDVAGRLQRRPSARRFYTTSSCVGRALFDGRLPLHDRLLCVSGRLSFELVQKAAVAGAPILVGVGAPTSPPVSLAADRGMTLCGFAREGRVNVYAGAERVSR